MEHTQFAGLTALDPAEPLSADGYSFTRRNPQVTDHFLKIGARTHRHDEHPALATPLAPPSVSAYPSGGSFPGDVAFVLGYTLVDSQGGETLVSPSESVITPPLIEAPASPPVASADYTGGGLRADTYYYVRTWVDGGGGETTPSPYIAVDRAPGYASGRIQLSGLDDGMAAASAAGWKVYKANSSGQFRYLASGTAAGLTDDGTLCADCVTPPPRSNGTHQRNRIAITVPSGAASAATAFRVYMGMGAGFSDPSLVGEYPPASAGSALVYTAYAPVAGRPPAVATSIAGASKIDPDTDILDWHWKRPVASAGALAAGQPGDVRMAQDSHRLYTPSGSAAVGSGDWIELPHSDVDVSIAQVAASGSGSVAPASAIMFRASGAARVDAQASGGSAVVTVNVPRPLSGSATWDPASIADGAVATTTVTVTGAVVGRPAIAGLDTLTATGAILGAVVTAADTVTVTLLNKTGGALDVASGTLTANVFA